MMIKTSQIHIKHTFNILYNTQIALKERERDDKIALKERERDDKILLTNLDSVDDDTREYMLMEKERIMQKRTQELQQPSFDPNIYQPYFDYLGGSGSG